jgi:hypothetical protein
MLGEVPQKREILVVEAEMNPSRKKYNLIA